MHAHHERFLVVAAIENADAPRSGSSSCSARDSRDRGPSLVGALNDDTWQPCGFTPDITCLIVPSFPPHPSLEDKQHRPPILCIEHVLQLRECLDAYLQRFLCARFVFGLRSCVSPGSTS
jgi:hypothetical protein